MTSTVVPRLHNWMIEDREYARQESRRGRRHAYQRLVPSRTALVVVDMVSFFVEHGEHERGILPNISVLADTLRGLGGTVAWVLPGWTKPSPVTEEFLGADIAKMFSESGGTGPLRDRVWRDFEVHDEDLLVEKTAASAFFPGRCDLPGLLEDRGIDTVLITGTVANVCCESSARDASTLGYRVLMVADATAARRDQDLNATLHTVYRTFGDVRPTAEVLSLLQASSATSLQ
ncbi:isochorismatase hydrolase [Kribbella flavida DSM 17836]|uniref:Isochorismatase hydrolase n=1 Tax=Kribbella flavida (strain DSM 17836 / JCM 10339 / NBRC 14399) TaxID=479435 RepID=D2PWE1_KRIFD|nr:isochorismatase family cysteine hydrolase [Kribbella flavida]ADB31593.1 isochorismatase hydrolase [Kribbella flavida DSM 17836]